MKNSIDFGFMLYITPVDTSGLSHGNFYVYFFFACVGFFVGVGLFGFWFFLFLRGFCCCCC